ncbi:MAG: hypothetical protein DI539_03005 [Flavobacterium psychrophilum]|nr:MAG: hypothetical protein DI539_03005 [Flavobacterium psychrophilum]
MATLSYNSFLWNSVNLHGVHSPFVFKTTKALTTKTNVAVKTDNPRALSQEATEILCRILVNLRCEKLVALGEDTAAINQLIRKCGEELNLKLWFLSTFAPITGNVDLVYISALESEAILPQIERLLPNIGSNTVCVIGKIHNSAQAEYDWETLKKDPRITVTIDTYHLGLIFFRPEQAKEHFMIRTKTSKVSDFLLGARNLWGLLY